MKKLPKSNYTPSGRITAPSPEDLDPAVRLMYDETCDLFGGPGGPRMPLLHTPGIVQAWGDLGAAISRAPVTPRFRALAIITVAAFWRAEMEWLMHAHEAVNEGISAQAIEAIRIGSVPSFDSATDGIVYHYVDSLQRNHDMDDATYDAARALLGDPQLVALTVVVGHFTNVAMTLRAHQVPIPDAAPRAFS